MRWIRIANSALLLAIFSRLLLPSPVSPLAENNIQSYSTIEGLTKKVAKLENEIKINQKEHEQNLAALRTQLVGHSEKFESYRQIMFQG